MIKACVTCGKKFYAERHARRFCSQECAGVSRRHGSITATCQRPGCGNEFEITATRKRRGFGKFCSQACAAAVAGKNANAAFVAKYQSTWRAPDGHRTLPMPPAPTSPPDLMPMLGQILEAIQAGPAQAAAELPTAAPQPIEKLADEYQALMLARGGNAFYASNAHRYILQLMRIAGISVSCEVDATKLELALGQLRGKYASETIRNIYRANRAFLCQLTRQGVYRRNPIEGVRMPKKTGDQVHARRALSDDEVARLLAATAARGSSYNMAPADRVLAYELALGTGLRGGEIRKLTAGNVVTDGPRPYIFVRASIAKNGKLVRQPLPSPLAAKLRLYIIDRAPATPLFPSFPSRSNLVRMLRSDLRAARVAWLDEVKGEEFKRRLQSAFLAYVDGERRHADFHSFRHTYVTRLAKLCPPAVAQRLARHADIRLTMCIYTHVEEAEAFAAVEALPTISAAVVV
jgi:integrase